MNNIQVSVICVTYNHEKYIEQALDSILAQQTTFSFEVLIGEDCSTDNTRKVLQAYEEKHPNMFTVFYREKNMGATKNEYDLFMKAKGKYIAALELDDLWTDPYKLQKQFDFLEMHSEYIGVAHDFAMIDKHGEIIDNQDNYKIKQFFNKSFTFTDFMEQGFIFQTGTHFYRNIFQDGEDYTIIYKAHTLIRDLTILSILLSRGNFYILPDEMSAYRRFFDENATNGRNLTTMNLAKDYYNTAKQLETIHEYLDGKVDLSLKWTNILESYFKGMIKGGRGYKISIFLQMYRNSSYHTKQLFKSNIKLAFKRKLGSI